MTLEENVRLVQERIAACARAAGRAPEEVTLCAATKTQTDETIRRAIAAGIRVCGENRVQEFQAHQAAGAYKGAKAHFIGHLQTNKVKAVVGKAELIHSVDSLHLLRAIHTQAGKLGICQDVLIEINIGGEGSKSGIASYELRDFIQEALGLSHVRLRGLMAIPPISTTSGGNRHFFAEMYRLYVDIKAEMSDNLGSMDCLSMGMSGDYEDAIAQGATLVRLGTALFGPRPPL